MNVTVGIRNTPLPQVQTIRALLVESRLGSVSSEEEHLLGLPTHLPGRSKSASVGAVRAIDSP